MPRAPQLQPQIQPAALPGVRVSGAPTPQSYGAQVGLTTARIGSELYEWEIIAADRAAVLEAETKAGDAQLEIIQHVSQLRGKEAATAPQFALEAFQKSTADLARGLSNERQRGLFAQLMRGKRDAVNRHALDHFNRENDRYLEETFKANLSQSVDIARANANSPVQVAFEKDLQTAKIKERAERLGYAGTPQEQDEIATVHSRTNTAVINGLLAQGEDLKAKAYYDKMVAQEHAQPGGGLLNFTAADRDVVQHAVEEGSTRGAAQRLVRDLLASGRTEAEILSHIDTQVDNPKIVDLAHQLVGRHFREQAALRKQEVDDIYLTATNKIEQHPSVHPRLLVNAEQWARLSLPERHALEERAKSLVRYDKPDRPNDDALWLDFLALSPDAVANLSRRDFDEQYWSRFDNHTRQRAEAQWNTYRDAFSRKQVADPKVTASLTFKDQVNNAWALSDLIDPAKERSKWTTEEMKMFVRFEDQAAQALQSYELTKLEGKRHATPDEVRQIIQGVRDNAVKKVFTEGWFTNKERPAISLEEDEKRQVFVPLDKIPKDSLDDLRRYIESLGKTVTADKLRRAYAQRILNNRQAFDAIVNEP